MSRYIDYDDDGVLKYWWWWWWFLDLLMMMMRSRYIEGEDQAVLSLLAVTHFVADWAENPTNEKLNMIKDFLIFTFQAIVKSAPLLISSAKTCQKDGDKLSPLSATMRSVFQWGKHRRGKKFPGKTQPSKCYDWRTFGIRIRFWLFVVEEGSSSRIPCII